MALRVRAVQAVEALTARRDGADNHPLPDSVFVIQSFAQRVDHADGLVPEHQSGAHLVLAFHDVHIGAADGGRGYPDNGLAGARHRLRADPRARFDPVRGRRRLS